ncbi:MAG TPA: hypothetical protein GX505_14100 [Clostridiales bacterium]|nr:hypothetical protein [Clostridiales bacterium]
MNSDYTDKKNNSILTCDSLHMTGDHGERWLSRPDSRLVLNPYNYDAAPMGGLTQAEYCNRPSIPLNVGYLDPWTRNSRGPEINNAVMLFEQSNDGGLTEAYKFETSWQPHKLDFRAYYPNGLYAEGYDYFYDHRTVVRNFKMNNEGRLVLVMEFSGKATINSSVFSVIMKNYSYAVAFNIEIRNLVFFKSIADLKSWNNPQGEPDAEHGFAAFEAIPDSPGKTVTIAMALDTYLVSIDDIKQAAVNAISDLYHEKHIIAAERFWNEYLRKVPPIEDFQFEYVDSMGVSMHNVRRMYYTGWVLLYASIAPPNPECGFPYRQMTAGKPCLWAYGDPRAVYTAAWDSLYGIQLLSYVDSDAAWDTFTGIMSLVDEDGMLAGESLPVMRSRTAWILYSNSGDKEALRRNFDNLERNLLWSIDHPYWIWMDNNPLDSTLKDCDFTAALLVDIPFFIKICEELGKYSKANTWRDKYDELMGNFIIWTFPADGSLPAQYYEAPDSGIDDGNGKRSAGNALWVTKGLYIQGLDKQFIDRLMQLFYSVYDPGKPFCGFPYVKVEEYQYTIYGLINHGYYEEARVMIETSIRDITRSNFFGENYTEKEPPMCWGVRPSLFGVVQLADGIWLRKGYRYDSGKIEKHAAFNR